ncbi:MAG: hypothetical protein AAFP26_08875 [Planctomycetota bacterium]
MAKRAASERTRGKRVMDTASPVKRRWRRVAAHALTVTLTASAAMLVAACVHVPAINQAFDVDNADIREDLRRMSGEPVSLQRPVIVLAGYRGTSRLTAARLEEVLTDDGGMVLNLSYFWASDIPPIGARVVDFVEEHFPSDDPAFTTEVDVVAISMGGLVARTAAMPPELRGETPDAKRLRIRTLYTLATPHDGAKLAEHIHPDAAAKQMIPGSDYIALLDEQFIAMQATDDAQARYDVVPYAVLRDTWVGASNTAPPGQEPIWVPGRMMFSHHLVGQDTRILADVARRIRGEEPIGRPSTPPSD